MRKEDFCDVIGNINETYVKEARMTPKVKKTVLVRWGMVAACLAVISIIGIRALRNGFFAPVQHGDFGNNVDGSYYSVGSDSGNEVWEKDPLDMDHSAQVLNIIVNEADHMASVDMDVQITSYEKLPYNVWEAVLDDFYTFAGISYDEFTSKLPDMWELSDFYSLSTPGYKDDRLDGQYKLHDYILDYQTDSGGRATVALCSFEEPLRDCFIVCDNPEQSVINGTPLVIYSYGDCYMVQFSHKNVNYDIETGNTALDELQDLLLGILDDSASASDK